MAIPPFAPAARAFALAVGLTLSALAASATGGATPFVRLEHHVDVGDGRQVHVTETFSPGAFSTAPRRAALLLPGPLTKGSFFDFQAEGYNASAILAARGFFVYTMDFEGTGGSTYPADGSTVSIANQAQAGLRVTDMIRHLRGVPRVDVVGESWGGGVAATMCADPHRTRSCVMTAMQYRSPNPVAVTLFTNPGSLAVYNALGGYWETAAPLYALLVAESPPDVQVETYRGQPGRYTTSQVDDLANAPFFDPSRARVPGLVIRGADDGNTDDADNRVLASEYGPHGAAYVSLPGAGHIPRLEEDSREAYWRLVANFLG